MRTIALQVTDMGLARLAEDQSRRIRTALMRIAIRKEMGTSVEAPAEATRECRVMHRSILEAADRRLFRALLRSYLHAEA